MKNKAVSLIAFLVLLLFLSCKKESSLSIIGEWMSRSVYTYQDSGSFRWAPTDVHPQGYEFSAAGRFGSWTDVPGATGTYVYDEQMHNLTLHYEADRYGSVSGTELLNVELLTNDKLILASYSSTGSLLYKIEYSKAN